MTNKQSTRLAVCTHEASHAVGFFHHGIPVNELHVDNSGGYCRPGAQWSDIPPPVAATVCLVGAIGEHLVAGGDSLPSDQDLDIANNWGRLFCLNRGQRRWVQEQATEIVQTRSAAILALAAELERQGTMGVEEIRLFVWTTRDLAPLCCKIYPAPPLRPRKQVEIKDEDFDDDNYYSNGAPKRERVRTLGIRRVAVKIGGIF